jgi:hypothetical protein
MGAKVLHTDDLLGKGHDWSHQSQLVSEWFNAPGPWIVEGVTVPRALRKWLEHTSMTLTGTGHPFRNQKPCDKVIYLKRAKVPRNQGQEVMAQGCDRVFSEIVSKLRARGVEVEFR